MFVLAHVSRRKVRRHRHVVPRLAARLQREVVEVLQLAGDLDHLRAEQQPVHAQHRVHRVQHLHEHQLL